MESKQVAFANGKALPNGGRSGFPVLALSMFLSALGGSAANVALPALGAAFDASFAELQWVVLAYLLGLTVFVLIAGRLGDLLGRMRILRWGLAIFSLASVVAAMAPDVHSLIAVRFIQGSGAALLMTLAVALVRDWVPAAQTGRAMGLLGTLSAVGTASGPALGGGLLALFSWQAIFLLPGGVALVGLMLLPPRDRSESPRSASGRAFDWKSSGWLILTLALYALAFASRWESGFAQLSCALLASLFGYGLYRSLSTSPSPLIDLRHLGAPGLRMALLSNALIACVMMGTLVIGPFLLSTGMGFSAAQLGLVMAFGPVISALSGVPAGRLVDRLGTARVAVLGLGLAAAGAGALAVGAAVAGLAGFLTGMLLLTPGYQLLQAANNTSAMLGAAPEERGSLSGLLALSRNLGLISGAALFGGVFSWRLGVNSLHASAAATQAAFSTCFLLAAGVLLLGLLGQWRLRASSVSA